MSIVRKEENHVVIDLKKVFQLLWKKKWIIIFIGLLFGCIAGAVAKYLMTPKYEAKVTLYVNNKTTKEIATTLSSSDLSASAQLVSTYSAIITSNSMLKSVIKETKIDTTPENLVKAIDISSINDTEVFQVAVLDPDPKAAANIANGIARLAPEKIADIVEGSSVKSVDPAEVPKRIKKPDHRIWAAAGIVLGMMIAMAWIVIRSMMDSSIKNEKDFEEWPYPILGTIPDFVDSQNTESYSYGYHEK